MVFHVLSRGNERRVLFEDIADDDAFVQVLAQTLEHVQVSLLAYRPLGSAAWTQATA